MARSVDVEGVDRRVRVLRHASVAVNDPLARLVLGGPQVGAGGRGVVPAWQRLGEGPAEDLAEVPGLPDREVLDQAEEVGPG